MAIDWTRAADALAARGGSDARIAQEIRDSGLRAGRIYYGDRYAVIQRDGDHTATMSRMVFGTGTGMAISFVDAIQYTDLSDALTAARIAEAEAEAASVGKSWIIAPG